MKELNFIVTNPKSGITRITDGNGNAVDFLGGSALLAITLKAIEALPEATLTIVTEG